MLPMTFESGTLAAKELKPELDAMKPKPKFKRRLPLPGPSMLLPLAPWRTEEREVGLSLKRVPDFVVWGELKPPQKKVR